MQETDDSVPPERLAGIKPVRGFPPGFLPQLLLDFFQRAFFQPRNLRL